MKFTGSGDDSEDDFCDMIANFGQGISKTIRAGSGISREGNVVKVGTMRWVRQAADQDRNMEKRQRALKGF